MHPQEMDAEQYKQHLGETIATLRKKAGYSSQESFAEAVGLHRTYIGAIERGERNVSIENLVAISTILNMPLSKLIQASEKF